ncbi:MAG: flagellar hook-basal body complex protein FliE [Xanthobacteraceae bacterium]
MTIPATPAAAANAYAALGRLGGETGSGAQLGGASAGGSSFGSILKDVIHAVTDAGAKADAQTQAVAVGKANMVDVVTAVAESETAIATLVSVRDKVIAAYEDILKMPI